jgi:hypothetical protein
VHADQRISKKKPNPNQPTTRCKTSKQGYDADCEKGSQSRSELMPKRDKQGANQTQLGKLLASTPGILMNNKQQPVEGQGFRQQPRPSAQATCSPPTPPHPYSS